MTSTAAGGADLAAKAGARTSANQHPIPPFTTEHEEFRAAVRRFVEAELEPHAREWEDARWFPNDVFTRLAELGYIGLKFPPQYGGDGDVVAGCHARRVDGGYIVNGSKMFITGGVRADVIVTAVRTTESGGHQGLSFLLVERGPGLHSSAIEKLGWHASDTAQISFDDVFVPEENLLGEENAGFYLIMANFQWERLLMALGAVGGMQAAFEKTLAYSPQREAFGRPIGKHRAIRHKLAEIAVKIEAGRDVTYAALRRYVAGGDAVREVTIAKLATQRAAFEVMDSCLQIHGGGYMVEYDIERAARDARLGPIGGGTDEIMKEILGRPLGL